MHSVPDPSLADTTGFNKIITIDARQGKKIDLPGTYTFFYEPSSSHFTFEQRSIFQGMPRIMIAYSFLIFAMSRDKDRAVLFALRSENQNRRIFFN